MTCFTPYTIRIFSSNTDLSVISIAAALEHSLHTWKVGCSNHSRDRPKL